MNPLPIDLQSRIEALYVHLDVTIPDSPGSGVDGFAPVLEHIKERGGVFLIKWDGQRQSRHYTAVVLHPEMEAFRIDDHTIELATAKTILAFADAVLDFPNGKP